MHRWLRGNRERRVGCYKRIPLCQISLSVSLSSKNHTHKPQTLLSCLLSYRQSSAINVCVRMREKTETEKQSPLPLSYKQPAFEKDTRGEQGGR